MVAGTAAQAYLAQRQAKFPPPQAAGGVDRIVEHFNALRSGLPPELGALFDDGTLAIGEVGVLHPDVATTTLDAGGYTIEFSTGMLVYAQTIVRALSGRFVEGAAGPKALELERVQQLLRDAITTYRRQGSLLWGAFHPHFDDTDVTVTPWLTKLRGDLLDCIARSMLAHELGHAAMHAGISTPSAAGAQEVDADRYGLGFFLPTMARQYEARIPIAAAGLAIRLFVSLERFGVTFSSVYPPQAKRLELLREALLPLADSAQRSDELSTFMVALLDQFDSLDDALDTKHVATPITVDRLRINLVSRLIEVGRGNIGVEAFIADLDLFAQAASRTDLATALGTLCEYYWNWADTVGIYFRDLPLMSIYSHEELIGMSRALRAVAAQFSDADRALLPERYRAPSSPASKPAQAVDGIARSPRNG